MNTSFTFTGREWDEDAGLYYYRARYYDASTGRFLQQDPHPGYSEQPNSVINKYSYANNTPIITTDPSGRFAPLIWLAIAVGTAVAAQNVSAATKSGEWNFAKLLGTALNGFAFGFLSTTLTGGTGFWTTVGISAGLGATHNIINQTIFTGSVKDWDSVGYSGIAGGLGAGVGYGVAHGVSGISSGGWEVLGQPVGRSKDLFNFPAGAAGALGGLFYNTNITSEDNSGIPKCMQINTMCGKIGE